MGVVLVEAMGSRLHGARRVLPVPLLCHALPKMRMILMMMMMMMKMKKKINEMIREKIKAIHGNHPLVLLHVLCMTMTMMSLMSFLQYIHLLHKPMREGKHKDQG